MFFGNRHFRFHVDWEPRHGRPFERGDLKYVILKLLDERPAHGYEIIRALEEQSKGFYTPSAGTVYPTLQLLEDLGYVTANQQDGKKVYTITDAGRKFLAEQAQVVDDIFERAERFWGPETGHEIREIAHELRELGQLLKRYGRGPWASPTTVSRIREVVNRARQEIEAILADESKRTAESRERPGASSFSTASFSGSAGSSSFSGSSAGGFQHEVVVERRIVNEDDDDVV